VEQSIKNRPRGSTETGTEREPFPGLRDGVTMKSKVSIDPEHNEIHFDREYGLPAVATHMRSASFTY
jgi:hypothetical protein